MVYAYASVAQQQRLGVRRLQGEHAVVQHHAGGIAMLVGRYFLIIPVARDRRARSCASSRSRDGGNVPHRHAAVHRLLAGRDGHPRRLDLLPGRRARPHRRAPRRTLLRSTMTTQTSRPSAGVPDPARADATSVHRARRCSTPRSSGAAIVDAFTKLDPRTDGATRCMFVVLRRQRLDDDPVLPRPRHSPPRSNVFGGLVVSSAVVHRAVRATSPKRRRRSRARRRPTRCARRVPRRSRTCCQPDGSTVDKPSSELGGRRRAWSCRRAHPRRR